MPKKKRSSRRPRRVDPGYLVAPAETPSTSDYVVCELQHDSQVAYTTGQFEGAGEADAEVGKLNGLLDSFNVKSLRSHFASTRREIRERVSSAPRSLRQRVTAEFAQSGFIQIMPRRARDLASLVAELNRSNAVWTAYAAPRPVPAAIATGSQTGTRNFEPTQGYLASAPNGIGAMAAWQLNGGRGRGVRIADIEGNWNLNHEDLPRGISWLGGTAISGTSWLNHGTAVLGEMVSRPTSLGTVGIANQARAAVHSAVINGVFNTGQAIRNVTRRLSRGDVMLIELQATGPRGRYVAMQYWNDVFSAIRAATARGITVVEAAGNGNENFDHRTYNNTGLQRDAGAIVVGAGVPPTNYFDYDGRGSGSRYTKIGVPRSRIWFSNYGRIVNVQAWGWHVSTLGYGDGQGGAQNRWYTLRFSGTSSASPIVTGAVACIQGRRKARRRRVLTPAEVRSVLIRTGTRQQAGPGVPLSQRIGPQPNLEAAFRQI